ncbi:hypothetical protein Tco_1417428 [Tanacetum coccineum]
MCVLAHIIGPFYCLSGSDLSDGINELKNEQQFGDFLVVGLGNGGNIDLYVEHHGYDIHVWFPKDNDDLEDYDEDECELDDISAFVEPQLIGEEEYIIPNSPGKDMVPILGRKFKDHEEMKIMNAKEVRCTSKVGRKGIKDNVSKGHGKEKVAEGKGKEKVAKGKGKEKVAKGSKVAEGKKKWTKQAIKLSKSPSKKGTKRKTSDNVCKFRYDIGLATFTVVFGAGGITTTKSRHHYGAAVVLLEATAASPPPQSVKPKRWEQQGSPRVAAYSPTPQGAAVVAVPSSDRHHDGGLRRFLGGFMGVSPAVTADTPLIAAPWRRLRGHERGGLDDDGGVVTMACKVGDDGGSDGGAAWWQRVFAGKTAGGGCGRWLRCGGDEGVWWNDSQCDVEETLLYGCRSTYRKSERKIIVDIRSLCSLSATLRFRWDSHTMTHDIDERRGITTTSPTPPWCGCGGCGGRSRLGRRHSGGVKQLSTARHPEGLRRHSPTPHGAAVVAVPSSDRHHDGGLAADSPYRSATHGRATAAAAAGKAAAVVVVPAVVTQMVARSDEDGGEDGVKILAGKDGGSPEKSAGEDGGSPETSAGKVFPAAAAVDRRRLAGN